MNALIKFIVLLIALAIGNVIYKINTKESVKVPPETWWGPGDPSKEDTRIVPFKIQVPNQILEDLRQRLKNARKFAPPLEGVHQHYGINTNLLKEIVNYWLTKYDWRERENFLNQYPQFKTNIQGLDVHFIHVKPKNVPSGVKTQPLLLVHGWPGSVREFYEIIPLLTTVQKDKKFVFEVIIPSLPGYGFSQAAVRPGLGAHQTAVIFKNLMKRLGFDRYYVQGGDWGSAVTSAMALYYPDRVKGIHLNMCVSNSYLAKLKLLAGSVWPSLVVEEKQKHKIYPLSNYFSNALLEFGYMHLQATKPDTIGVALNDSPVGLAAYIIEKFTTWTNPEWKNRADGGLLERFTYDKILDNIMIYWVTNSITTSMRIYAESINKESNVFDDRAVITVPSACALFDHEIIYQPVSIFKDRFAKLVQVNEYDGGHFAAFEVPESLAKDIWLAVSKFEEPPKPNK
ncbi:Juvenile hormone epoxide hydrolase 1-like Protein [Tribolium castaneum]|uniref:Epoxide hydrolase n=1 Tax=Tribolium castaneum TaxID=7070 RepID=D6WGJ4_TRICA|nr:Juvenile hormone epoxide hydrolase 1-like Protein [Tribolium castaneum]